MIRISGKTIFYKHWHGLEGAMKINDLITSNLRIISYSCFKDKFCFPVSLLKFCVVTSAIKSSETDISEIKHDVYDKRQK